MKTFLNYLLLFPLLALPLAAQPASFDFSQPVVLSPVQAPGTWYPDRFPPNGFVSPQTAPDGTQNSLKESIAATDVKPGANFQNTQGRKFDMPPNTLSITIALYVPAAWQFENARKAGFWATACTPACSGGGDFPIIEFQGPITSPPANGPSYHPNGGVAGFYGFNNMTGNFDLIGLPTGFTYNSWVQLTMTLVPGTGFIYTAGDKSIPSPLAVPGDTNLGNTILQGYNYGFDYDIFWNGFGPASYQLRHFVNLTSADSYIDITNTGASATAILTGQTPAQNNINGSLCVNIYTFAADEQEVSCCSCLVTPNALWSASVKTALLNSTLTSSFPNEVVVKLISTVPSVNGGIETCNPATISMANTIGIAPGDLAKGALAWGITPHGFPTATGPNFQLAETPFIPATLSAAELARDVQECQFIQVLGSGQFGICKGCSNIGLGAAAQ